MARAKRASDELYNARRRVRRAAESAARAGNAAEAARLRELAQTGGTTSISELNAAYEGARVQASASVSASTSRARKPSDDMYNARRRLRRLAARVERQTQGTTGPTREQALSYAARLREMAQAGQKLTSEERQALLQRLADVRGASREAAYGFSAVARRNAIFMQQINAAGVKGAQSSIAGEQATLFWASTARIWSAEGGTRDERYEKILDYFYVGDTAASKDVAKFREWLKEKKELDWRDVAGDLGYVYEWVTEQLNKDVVEDAVGDPDVPYPAWSQRVLSVR